MICLLSLDSFLNWSHSWFFSYKICSFEKLKIQIFFKHKNLCYNCHSELNCLSIILQFELNLHLGIEKVDFVHSSAIYSIKRNRPQIRWTPCSKVFAESFFFGKGPFFQGFQKDFVVWQLTLTFAEKASKLCKVRKTHTRK